MVHEPSLPTLFFYRVVVLGRFLAVRATNCGRRRSTSGDTVRSDQMEKPLELRSGSGSEVCVRRETEGFREVSLDHVEKGD